MCFAHRNVIQMKQAKSQRQEKINDKGDDTNENSCIFHILFTFTVLMHKIVSAWCLNQTKFQVKPLHENIYYSCSCKIIYNAYTYTSVAFVKFHKCKRDAVV